MIEISPAARNRIQELVDAEVVQSPALRITLDGSDPSATGRAYAISLVDKADRLRTEIAVNVDGIRVFLNLDTSNLLSGAMVDWTEGPEAAGFQVIDPNAAPPQPTPRPASELPISGPLAERVQQVIDEVINPGIAAHGGFVEMVDVSDDALYIRMGGGCQGCSASQATLRLGIERMVREYVPEITEIVDVTDHESGVTPFYS
ncbi:MAG: NifU family protein [Gemmatimonadota bacterium]|jgi:Fe/S biogenesis protein NfuA|nr:NifU family protein [Gemmatimonadota bacterium]